MQRFFPPSSPRPPLTRKQANILMKKVSLPFPTPSCYWFLGFAFVLKWSMFCLFYYKLYLPLFPQKKKTHPKRKLFQLFPFQCLKIIKASIKSMLYISISMHSIIKILPASRDTEHEKLIEKLSRLVKLNFCGFTRNSWIFRSTESHCRNQKTA